MSEREHLALLLRVNTILNSTKSMDDVLVELIAQVINTLGAERGFVVFREHQEWVAKASHAIDVEAQFKKGLFSRTLVDKVAREGEPLLALDAQQTYLSAPSVQVQGIHSVVCAPLRWSGQIRGVVYADHRVKSGVFKQKDLELLGAIADQASRALETAALHRTLRDMHHQSLGRAISGEGALTDWESKAVPETVDRLLGSLQNPESPIGSGRTIPIAVEEISQSHRAYLLGELRVECDLAGARGWKSRKDRELFAYLACHHDQLLHEDRLVEQFWSRGGKKGRHSLHNSITQIRKVLGDGERRVLQRKGEGYTLADQCWIDLRELFRTIAHGRGAAARGRWGEALAALQRAESLAQRELLEDQVWEWLTPIRLRVSEQMSECRSLLADYFGQRGKHLMAIELWRRILDHDNCDEAAYRGLIEAYRALGRRAEAVRAYRRCVQALAEELDLEPPSDLEALLDF